MTTTGTETATLLQLLDTERAALLAMVERVPAERRSERPAPNQWSVAEILEHVARVDTGVVKLIALRGAEPLTATAEELERARLTPQRASWVRGRATRVDAPDRVLPRGGLSAESALEQLASARTALKAAYLSANPAMLDGAIHPHPFLGPITIRGWVELVAHHDARHAKQIAEMVDTANLGTPKQAVSL